MFVESHKTAVWRGRNNYEQVMKYVLWWMLACPACFLSGQNSIDVPSGTVLAYRLTPERLIVAADSRFAHLSRGQIIPITNNGCKIISLSSTSIFFYVGGTSFVLDQSTKKMDFTANDFARQAFRAQVSFRTDPAKRLYKAAQRWEELMQPQVNELIRSISPLEAELRKGLGGFGGLEENGHPFLYLAFIGIRINPPPARPSVEVSAPEKVSVFSDDSVIATGDPSSASGIAEFWEGKTPRARQAFAEFTMWVSKKPLADYDIYRVMFAVKAAVNGRVTHRSADTLTPSRLTVPSRLGG